MAKTEKKIFLDRSDDLSVAVDKLIKVPAEKIILNVPKNSVLGESLHNFQILKREGFTAGKEIIIESIDDHILEVAALCGLKAVNPVFKTRERAFSDIVPRAGFPKRISDVSVPETKEKEAESFFKKKKIEEGEEKRLSRGVIREVSKESRQPKERKPRSFYFKRLVWLLGLAIFAFVVFEVAVNILPRAEIKVTLKKNIVNFSSSIRVDTAVKEPDISVPNALSLPGELLIAERNLSINFPASGTKEIETKATGILFVYNAYSSAPQTLVKNTRFQAPDGHVFRLDKEVVVPGAKIVNGQIQPSKVSVAVTADQAGADYNIAPVAGWRIPGFAGTPRYQGFYAESLASMTGGFIGSVAAPSVEDIFNATTSIEQSLLAALESQMSVLRDSRFKLFNKAKKFTVLQETIQDNTASSDQFAVYAAAEMRELVFDEDMLKDSLADQAAQNLPAGLEVSEFRIDYGDPQLDLAKGQMIFDVEGAIVFVTDFDQGQFKKGVAGLNEVALRTAVFALPGLERATISLWPFWVKKVPANVNKISVSVD